MERESALVKIPPELRNRIYRFATLHARPIDVTGTTKKKESALLATCEQIREEALQMFYHENVFYCRLEMKLVEHPDQDVEAGFQRAVMKSLKHHCCWITALGVAAASLITDFRIQIETNMAAQYVIPTQFGLIAENVCKAIRDGFAEKKGTAFMKGWVLMFCEMGLDPRAVKFIAPDPIKSVDDALNKVTGEEWEKHLEELLLEQESISPNLKDMRKKMPLGETENKKDSDT